MTRRILLLLLIFVINNGFANSLKDHHSPYLAMHGNDPIQWMEWSDTLLQRAQKENKLLFISVGYYACHWCHVMHRESFSNKAIAKLLNEHYIAVKVDRELNPVLDKRLIEFVSATRGHAGWPLSVFITPQGDPLIGLTYMPREQFSRILKGLTKEWDKDSKLLSKQAAEQNKRLHLALQGKERQGDKAGVIDSTAKLIKQVMENADTFSGGFGQQTKFPSTPQLHALMVLNKDKKDQSIDSFIRLSLDSMASKGLHDDLAGGFYRYTVDQQWDTPHFEKMLYNNATLAILYADAAKQYDHTPYRHVAIQTLHFMTTAMQGEQGAFIASLSAVDDKGVEGGYYLWDSATIKKQLSEQQYHLAQLAWKLDTSTGKKPLKVEYQLSTLAKQLKLSEKEISQSLDQIRLILLKHQQTTRQLPRDDKLLTAWNALTLAAFVTVNDPQFNKNTQRLAEFLMTLWDGKQLYRSSAKRQKGTLQDYASTAWSLLLWSKQSNNKQAAKVAQALLTKAWDDFYIKQQWHLVRQSALKQGVNASHLTDTAYPTAETLLLRASFLSEDSIMIDKAKQVLHLSSQFLEENPYSYASLIELSNQLK